MRDHDIHIHVPAGAIPKDGPSAGVAMATALASLLSGRPVRSDVAMTGEITLTGQVLPIGGLKEKALAAQRGGIRLVIAPARNEQDIDEIPEHLRKDLEFKFVSEIGEVLEVALQRRRAPRPALRRAATVNSGSRTPGLSARGASGPICWVCVPRLRILALQSPSIPRESNAITFKEGQGGTHRRGVGEHRQSEAVHRARDRGRRAAGQHPHRGRLDAGALTGV